MTACAILFVALSFSASVARAQDSLPAPAASCAVPDVDGRTIAAARPVLPAAAEAQHVFGEVTVRVTLDDRSNVIGAAVVRSSSALLNEAAIAAARASTFATRIRNCVPVGDSYLFVVRFDDPNAPIGVAPAAMTAFFSGAWRCTNAKGDVRVRIFGLGPGGRSLIEAASLPGPSGASTIIEENYAQHGSTLDVLRRFPVVLSGTSSGWDGAHLIFNTTMPAGATPSNGTLTYERLDNDHFTRSVDRDDGIAAEAGIERCTRIASSP